MTRHHALLTIGLAVMLAAGWPAMVGAQDQRAAQSAPYPTPDRDRGGAFELFLGGEWLLSESLGSSTATMLQNNAASAPYNYFSTSGTRDGAPALRVGLGYAITEMFTVEGGFLVSRGNVSGTIGADVEQVPGTTVTSRLTQYFFDASLLAYLPQVAFSDGAGTPFLEAGAGYLRQMQEGNAAVETGQIYHFGGGVRYLWGSRGGGRMSGVGLRAGARLYVRHKGLSFGSAGKVFPALNGGLVVVF